MNYDDAASFCLTHGMKLFIADSNEEETALIKYSNNHWRYGSFWVAGKVLPNCNTVSVQDASVQSTNVCESLNYFHCEYKSE